MNKLLSFLKTYAASAGMIAFLVVFYASFSLMQEASAPDPALGPAAPAHMTPEEIREREDRFKENVAANTALSTAISLGFIALMGGGIAVCVWIARRRADRRPLFTRTLDHGEVPWGMRAIFNIFLLLLFIEALLLSLEFAVFWFGGREPLPRDLFVMLNSIVRDILIVSLLVWLVRKRFGRPLSDVGLTTRDLTRQAGTGVLAYLAVLPALVVVLILTQAVGHLFSYKFTPQPVVEMYLREDKHGVLIFFTLFVAILGPLMEEIFFRGFAYKAFRTRYGVMSATFLTAGIFAALHASLIAFVPIFFLGVFLGGLYEKTGSLVPGMTAHVLHNLLMVSLTLGFKALSG